MKEQVLLTNGVTVSKEEFTKVTYELNKLWDYNKDITSQEILINREAVRYLYCIAKGKSNTLPPSDRTKNILAKILKAGLINEDGSINDSTKNIVLTMQLQSGNLLFPFKTVSFPNAAVIKDYLKDKTEVTLTNGSTIYKNDFRKLTDTLTSVSNLLNGSIEGVSRAQGKTAVEELHKKANNISHDISGDASKTLKSLGLITCNGDINDPTHYIVRCAVKEDRKKLLLINPISERSPNTNLSNTTVNPAIVEYQQAKL
jgi:hypothetical protein